MDNEFWTALGAIGGLVGGIGGITGVIALFQTCKANKIAQRANELAETANEIGRDAQVLAQKAFDVSRDQTRYYWESWCDLEVRNVVVQNQGPKAARDVTVNVTLCNEIIAKGHSNELPRGKSIVLPGADALRTALESGLCVGGDGFAVRVDKWTPVEMRIDYVTESGIRRSETLLKPLGKFR